MTEIDPYEAQRDGPYFFVPADRSRPPKSIQPGRSKPSPGRIVQVRDVGGRTTLAGAARAVIAAAARFNSMSEEERSAMLLEDKDTYGKLAQAAARVVEIETKKGA